MGDQIKLTDEDDIMEASNVCDTLYSAYDQLRGIEGLPDEVYRSLRDRISAIEDEVRAFIPDDY